MRAPERGVFALLPGRRRAHVFAPPRQVFAARSPAGMPRQATFSRSVQVICRARFATATSLTNRNRYALVVAFRPFGRRSECLLNVYERCHRDPRDEGGGLWLVSMC